MSACVTVSSCAIVAVMDFSTFEQFWPNAQDVRPNNTDNSKMWTKMKAFTTQ